MSDSTSCQPGGCGDTYQDEVLPTFDLVANLVFTVDLAISMIVLGSKSFFKDYFNQIDFLVVFTSWADLVFYGVNFSALRALRVLRPMKLVRYFKGIQSVIGSIYLNVGAISDVIQMMIFWLIIFGILGLTLFGGMLQHRCVVKSAYPSQTSGITYGADYADVNATAGMGEFEYFCTASDAREAFPFPYRCASYMTCDLEYGNPHHGAISFDNMGHAFLLMFQIQTLSAWFEIDYWTSMTVGVYASFYCQGIIFLVGFIVSQLFVAIVCFSFEKIERKINQPVFAEV